MNYFLKYRKTALISCSIVFGLFLFHLIGAYVYSDGKYVGLPGGSVSVGIVGDANDFQPLNPLAYGSGKTEDMLYNLMFRGLIRLNPQTEIYEWNLANCDISDIKKIQCQLRDDAVWSDDTKITTEDIIATAKIFGESASNKNVQTAWKNAKISSSGSGEIIIENTTANTYIIDAMTYPILRSDTVDQIKNDRLKKESYITSGPFIFESETDDTEYGFHRITLAKNPNYKKTVWLDKFHFKIFPDVANLERAADTLNIIIPPVSSEKNMKLGKRFESVNYATYEFFGAFFNTNTLDNNLRNILHKYLGAKFQESGELTSGQILARSIFSTGSSISGKQDLAMDFEGFMNEKGYKKKHILLAEAKNIETTLTSGGTIPKMRYFTNGSGYSILYSDDPKAEISLTGRIPASTTSVSVNGYTLQEYSTGSTTFVYRISKALGTIKDGKNTYNLQLTQENGSVLRETLTIYYTTNAEQMQQYKNEVEASLVATLNTPELITKREEEKNAKIASIEALEENTYYNAKLEPYTLKIAFISDREVINNYMTFVESSLRQMGLIIEPVPMTTKELDAMIKENKKNYDIIILGISSSNNIASLGHIFFSETNNSTNFSNLSVKNFVTLFDNLRNITDETKLLEAQEKIVTEMNNLGVFLPFSRPEHSLYIDRNLKGLQMPKILANTSLLAYVFDILSIKDDYKISTEWKGIWGFFHWLGQSLSPEVSNK